MYDTEKRVELVKKTGARKISPEEAPRDLPAVCPVHSIVCVPCGNGAHSSRPDADHRPGNVRLYPAA